MLTEVGEVVVETSGEFSFTSVVVVASAVVVASVVVVARKHKEKKI